MIPQEEARAEKAEAEVYRLRAELARVEGCCARVEAVLAFCDEDHGPNTWVPRLRAVVAGAGR